jgi:hypothetical protein
MIFLLFCSYFRLDKGLRSLCWREILRLIQDVKNLNSAIQKVKRDATLSLFFFPFCLSLMCGSLFLKKEQQVFCCWLREKKEND